MNFFRAFLSVGGITFLSRLLGLLRDVVVARVFGAGPLTDAFFAAFRLPNMLRRFTAEGAMTQAFVPVYAARRRDNPDAAARAAGEILAWLAGVLLALSGVGLLFAPWIIALLAPGLEESALAADLFRIVFPYILFISLVSLFAGMLNAVGRFSAAACAPLLLNAAMLAAALWWAPLFARPIFALAWGVFAGGILQLLWLVWNVRRAGLFPPLTVVLRPSAEVKKIARLLWRGAVGAGAAQVNLLINLALASFLAAGSISWLYYADRLMELPVGLIGATLATVVLPGLAARAADDAAFSGLLDQALRLILFLSLPAAAGLALLALPLTATLFMHGAFDATDAQMTGRAVLAYAAGVAGLVMTRPLAAAFFARQDASVPVKAAFASMAATQLFNVIFVFALGLGHAGLALSVGLAAYVNAGVLFVILRRRGWYRPTAGWVIFGGRTAAALAVMSGTLWLAAPPGDYWLTAPAAERVLSLLGCVGAAAAAYFVSARLFGIRFAHFRAA